MEIATCEERQATIGKLRELVEIPPRSKTRAGATLPELAQWFDRRDQDEDYRTSLRPEFSALQRRLMEHLKANRTPDPQPSVI